MPWVQVVVVAALACVPGLWSLPVVDRDEARFAQASRQMYESVALPESERVQALHGGGLAVPHVIDVPRLNKPPMIYWLQSASAAVFTAGDPRRDAIWMYRVPSLLAALAVALVVWRLGAAMFAEPVGRLAAMATAAAPVMAWEARQGRADMVLVLCTVVAMGALWKLWRGGLEGARPGWRWPLMLWAAIGLGVLTKGPITPMAVALAAVTLSIVTRRWRWLLELRPAVGAVMVAAMVAPWVYAVASHVGFDRYLAIVHDEVLGRSVEPKEGHWAPPGYHLLVVCVVFWPGVMLAGHALLRAIIEGRVGGWRRWRPADPAVLFCLAWIVPSWIVFELVSTKLPHYTMPLLPGLGLLGAAAAFRADRGELVGVRDRLTRLGLGAWIAVGACFAALPLLLLVGTTAGSRPGWQQALITAATLLAVLAAVSMLVRSRRAIPGGRYSDAQRWGVFAMVPLLFMLIAWLLPEPMSLSTRAWAALDAPQRQRPLAMLEYHEDSMVFHTRAAIRRIDPEQLEPFWSGQPLGLVLARSSVAERTPGAAIVARVSGFNYSRGRHEDLVWMERLP